jgi:hypothetical protein
VEEVQAVFQESLALNHGKLTGPFDSDHRVNGIDLIAHEGKVSPGWIEGKGCDRGCQGLVEDLNNLDHSLDHHPKKQPFNNLFQ